jgi:hypothetical protein
LENFDPYDIIADIVPGVYSMVFILYLSAPIDLIKYCDCVGGPEIAIIFIAISYIVGRIVRNISIYNAAHVFPNLDLYDLSKAIINILDEHFPRLSGNIFEEELKKILSSGVHMEPGRVEKFRSLVSSEIDLKLDEKQVPSDQITYLKNSGFAKLYGRKTLYQRYTIVAEFYNGVMNATFILFWIYLSSWLVSNMNIGDYYKTGWTEASPQMVFIVLLAMLLVFSITYKNHVKFEERRAISFVNCIIELYDDRQN